MSQLGEECQEFDGSATHGHKRYICLKPSSSGAADCHTLRCMALKIKINSIEEPVLYA